MLTFKFNYLKTLLILCFLGTASPLWADNVEETDADKAVSDRFFKLYNGLELSFGMRSFRVNALQTPLMNTMNVVKGGGSFGLILGNEYFKIPVRFLGLYTESIVEPYTVDLYQFEIHNNIYLSGLFKYKAKKVQPYLLYGFNFTRYSFYGTHVPKEFQQGISESHAEPLIGRKQEINFNSGMGLEYTLLDSEHFVILFIESKHILQLKEKTKDLLLENSSIKNNFNLNLGVRFGFTKLIQRL